jgi:hypothetical protein
LERKTSQTGIVYYASPLLEKAGVIHAFSTRIGGISTGPFDSLNLGNPAADVQDDKQHIHENYRRLQQAIADTTMPRCWVHQVHGPDVVFVRRHHEFTSGSRADALISDDSNRMLTIRTADCVPMLLASENGKCVAAVHAGWRGVIANIAAIAIRELTRLASTDPKKILAAIGPCISGDAFEVGAEVLAEFNRVFPDNAPIRSNHNGKGHVDLPAAVRMQLQNAGLCADKIDSTDRCTYRDAEEFFSHRRERGITGRMAALIAPRAS